MSSVKTVLIIGGSGFVGSHLALKLREGYKVFLTYRTRRILIPGVVPLSMEVRDQDWIKRVVYTAMPDVILYAAGNNDVEWSELHPRETEAAHAGGAANIMTASTVFQPKFIYFSNCFIFDGNRGNYRETDTVIPSSTLGKAKVAGENCIKGRSTHYLIVRSTPLFGRGNGLASSFLDKLRAKLERGERYEISTGELHSFAPVTGFTNLIIRLIEGGFRNKVFHYGGLTKCSLYDFARKFAERFGYDPSLITRHSSPRLGSMGEEAVLDYSLNFSETANALKLKPLLLEEGLDLLEKDLVSRL